MGRVLLLIGELGYGGAERQLVELAKGLREAGWECLVCCLSGIAPLAAELRAASIEVVVFPRLLPVDVTRIPRLVWLIRRSRIRLIHSFLFTANAWGSLAAALTGVPIVTSERTAQPRCERCSCSLAGRFGGLRQR